MPETKILIPTRLDRTERARPVDVTGRSPREIESVTRGMLINMHQDWFVAEVDGAEADKLLKEADHAS